MSVEFKGIKGVDKANRALERARQIPITLPMHTVLYAGRALYFQNAISEKAGLVHEEAAFLIDKLTIAMPSEIRETGTKNYTGDFTKPVSLTLSACEVDTIGGATLTVPKPQDFEGLSVKERWVLNVLRMEHLKKYIFLGNEFMKKGGKPNFLYLSRALEELRMLSTTKRIQIN